MKRVLLVSLGAWAVMATANAKDIAGPLTMTILDGSCAPSSKIEKGPAGGDFRDQSKVDVATVQCDGVTVAQLANGHVLIGFVNRGGGGLLPSFGSSQLLRDKDGALSASVEHLYRNLATEQPGKSPPLDVEGICFLEKTNKDVARAKTVRCVAKYEDQDVKEVYKIDFNAFRGETKRF